MAAEQQTQSTLMKDSDTFQVVSFGLGKEEYGVNIMIVQEIILMGRITQVPEVPEFLLGVINLRGNVIPIVDLRKRFGLAEKSHDDETRIVVVNLDGWTVGIVVDTVNEVLRISQEQVSSAPPSICSLGTEYLLGLARLENRLLILLDMEKILGSKEALGAAGMESEAKAAC